MQLIDGKKISEEIKAEILVETKKFIKENKLNWLNASDLKGWNGKAIEDYFVYATPTMFFVDSKGKIEAKPLTSDEIRKIF